MISPRVSMKAEVKLVECPRDAWQGLAAQIPVEVKVSYLRALVGAGFKHIDAVSFVSPKAVPQMADSEEVLELLDPPDDVEIIGIVVNEKGAERAVATEAVQTVGFPYSVSPAFLRKNANQTLEEAVEALERIKLLADEAGMGTVAYISMAFGNPYGDPWNETEVVEAVRLLFEMGITQISLADTVGLASAQQVSELVRAVAPQFPDVGLGVHLHSRPEHAAEKVLAAYDAGARRFDCALGGLGGCPFAQDLLVGNIPTERVLEALGGRGVPLPLQKPLDAVLSMSAEVARKYTTQVVH